MIQRTDFSTTYQIRIFGRWDLAITLLDNQKMVQYMENQPKWQADEEGFSVKVPLEEVKKKP